MATDQGEELLVHEERGRRKVTRYTRSLVLASLPPTNTCTHHTAHTTHFSCLCFSFAAPFPPALSIREGGKEEHHLHLHLPSHTNIYGTRITFFSHDYKKCFNPASRFLPAVSVREGGKKRHGTPLALPPCLPHKHTQYTGLICSRNDKKMQLS